jgi:hypothetical protein
MIYSQCQALSREVATWQTRKVFVLSAGRTRLRLILPHGCIFVTELTAAPSLKATRPLPIPGYCACKGRSLPPSIS